MSNYYNKIILILITILDRHNYIIKFNDFMLLNFEFFIYSLQFSFVLKTIYGL